MNHHYPDSYHGYGRSTGAMQGMAYGGSYGDPASMTRMSHPTPREGYQISPYPMMQQSGGMYPQGSYMGQQRGNPYNMGSYGNYGMSGMNQSMMIRNRSGDMTRMGGGNMMGSYYGPSMTSDPHASSQPGGMSNHPSSYNHNQSGSHMQQAHMGMMAVQAQQTVPSQTAMPVSGQGQGPPSMSSQPMAGQISHGPAHPMPPEVNPHSNTGTFAGQNSPLMIPRTHHVPQHPMRHPTTQQNPQEVADNILQMASSYPSNQTVQVPLKSRPAPYHIPRSPHYSVAHSDLPHTSPNPHQQAQQSPVASCQASPSPSSASVKSPTPVLAPIPNPIPSPGISGLKSPCNQGMSPCGTQRSPAHMGSIYSGHSQGGPPSQCGSEGPPQLHHGMSPTDSQHYSPCNMTPTHNFSSYSASPSAQRSSTLYSPCSDPSILSNIEQVHQSSYSSPTSSSPCSNNFLSYANSSKHGVGQTTNSHPGVSAAQMGSNPLMSLQKLVMLPETQVVDPKSVVNDACLSAQQNEGPKNVDGPAERLAEGSSHSVGCQGQFSSHGSHAKSVDSTVQPTENHISMAGTEIMASVSDTTPQHFSSSLQMDRQEGNFGNPNKDNSTNLSSELDSSQYHENSDLNLNDISGISQIICDSTLQQSKVDKNVNDEVMAPVTEESTREHSIESAVPNHSADTHNDTANTSTPCVRVSVESTAYLDDRSRSSVPNHLSTSVDGSGVLKLSNGNDKISESDGQYAMMTSERKNGKVKEEAKCVVVQCRSPGVLSEVPVVANGLPGTACGKDDDLEQDCGNGVHAKIQNAFSSLVKAKFARAKRTSQFSCVTPCSIAVGADERAACERFAFRRNGFCRTLRTSRVVCPGRIRSDSTGNGDSDESLENVSERYLGHTESPQDGNRKKTASTAKRRDHKRPNIASASSKVSESDSKPAEPITSGSNGCVSYNNEAASDDDVCYYEGVDSSDIFINGSSDESITSSTEVKQNSSIKGAMDKKFENHNQDDITSTPKDENKADKQKQEPNCETEDAEQDQLAAEGKANDQSNSVLSQKSLVNEHDKNLTPSSPPAKRLRRSSGQKAQEKPKTSSISKRSTSNNSNEKSIIDLTNDSAQRVRAEAGQNSQGNAREQTKRLHKFRPSILSHHSPGKYPVVVLEKSKVSVEQPSVVKQEVFDQNLKDEMEHSTSFVCSNHLPATLSGGESTVCETVSVDQKFKVDTADRDVQLKESNDVKVEPPQDIWQSDLQVSISVSSKSNGKKKSHKRKHVKGKGGKKIMGKTSRHAEVKDSFKSMKFSRTLDLMKSQRKRETTSVGPFIRISGKPSAPDSVSVFNQPIPELSSLLTGSKHKHLKNKKVHPAPAATTIRMVTNLPTDKTAMVPSTRTISQTPWVCAFCAHHSSYKCLGDLFGPYFKEREISRVESIAQEESKKSDSSIKDSKSNDASTSARKSKDLTTPERKGIRRGKSPLSKQMDKTPPPPEEIWVHEACAMWSPGVYLVGNKMYGLDEAVKDAADTMCSVCRSKGAMIGCLHKGCSMKYHFVCAVDKDCFMDEENLSLLCSKHKDKRLSSAGLTRS